jgi:hypothetical protein
MEIHDEERWNLDSNARTSMSLDQCVETIRSREDFVSFVKSLRASLSTDSNGWENRNLGSYLEAVAAWVEDMDGYYENRGQPVPQQPDWKVLGEILLAATLYE